MKYRVTRRMAMAGLTGFAAICAMPATISAEDANAVSPFGDLEKLIGKTLRGEPQTPEAGPQVADIQTYSWAVGRHAISITHALEDGSYGGETLLYPNKEGDLVYVYVTSAGFHTDGVMKENSKGQWVATEKVEGHPEISEVRSTSYFEGDSWITESEYLKGGEWVPGHGFIYQEVTGQRPSFRLPKY